MLALPAATSAAISGLKLRESVDSDQVRAGAKMLNGLHGGLASRGISFHIVGVRGQARDVLQADGRAEKTDGNAWTRTFDSKPGERKGGLILFPAAKDDGRTGSADRLSLLALT